jgi:hypothetical protein
VVSIGTRYFNTKYRFRIKLDLRCTHLDFARWGFFPVLGQADGLRQSIHVEDLAKVCVVTMDCPMGKNRAYDVSVAEELPY